MVDPQRWLVRVRALVCTAVGPQILDNDGGSTNLGYLGDYSLNYNLSAATVEPLEPIAQLEFDMWTGLPPRPPNGTQPPPLPPGSVAVASSAAQLLTLLQEVWNGGPRAILLLANISLQAGEWPQDGAALKYNVTLVGPVTGAPVWLQLGGLQLARSGGASAATAGTSVQLQLLRLRLLYGCTLEVPQVSLDALRYNTALAACAASAGTSPAVAGCSPSLTLPAGALLQWAAGIEGQVAVGAANTSSATAISLAAATLGSVLFVNSSIVGSSDGAAAATALADDVPCGSASLLLALRPLLPEQLDTAAAPRGRSSATPTGAIVGGAVGGSVALLCVAAAVVLALRSLRRRREGEPGKQIDIAEALSDAQMQTLSAVIVEHGPTGHDGEKTAAGSGAGSVGGHAASTDRSFDAGPDFRLTFSALPEGEQKVRHTMMDELRPPPPMVRAGAAIALLPADAPPGGAAGACQGAPWVAMEGEMSRMITNFQVVAEAATPKAGAAPRRARTELGRGGFGVVMLGRWRGLPVAVKLVLLPLNEKPGRRERLAREVALTSALVHPHIVPTYDFMLTPVREDNAAALMSLQEAVDGGTDQDEGNVVAMQLRIVMQYCEAGTLRDALGRGAFDAPFNGPAEGSQTPTPDASCSTGTESVAAATYRAGGFGGGSELTGAPQAAMVVEPGAHEGVDAPAAAEAAAAEAAAAAAAAAPAAAALDPPPLAASAGTEADAGTPGMAAAPATATPAPEDAAAIGSALATVAGARARPTCWEDLRAVPNLALALLAARDVLSGLEYLHTCAVVHGDLTECNILLKRVRPTLPAAVGGTAAARNGGGGGSTLHSAPKAGGPAGAVGARHQSVDASPISADAATAGSSQPVLARATAPALFSPAPSGANNAGSIQCSSAGTAHDDMALRLGSTLQLTVSDSAALLAASGPLQAAVPPSALGGTRTDAAAAAAAGSGLAQVAEKLLRYSFKIADFGLSVQMKGPDQTHASNMAQGTPFFAAPEVVVSGRQSTAADCYSFGVVFWLLLHGVALAEVRQLLRIHAYAPVAPELLRHISPDLPRAAHSILRASLQLQPAARPSAFELRRMVEELLQEVAGPELAWLLLGAERVEVTTSAHQPL
ncbi:putative serine/threonine-protein kinase [Tetrabaena socialis]|uniref:Putative serine/threonine-protein kinase n=1 Tax=Tetrabaena socialis TaxID=47790 RepID=A0A2J7ZMQ2_9CHLO|nr:putative serine/threonine-protein kinase [Tetrabaena socialis]|eukprot:PNH01537.1 putative serine/threonine-protein kinase [Tetrabaena socialis]